jgi:hypothetical protein
VRTILKLSIGLGTSFFVLGLNAYVWPEFFCNLLAVALGVVLLALFVIALWEGITNWRKTSNAWFVPAAACLVFLVGGYEVGPLLGPKIADRLFARHLAIYASAVNEFKSGRLTCESPCKANIQSVNGGDWPPNVSNIWGAKCNDGGVILLFRTKTDVPLFHEGYYFRDYGGTSDCSQASVSPEIGWPHVPFVRHVEGDWYHFSDMPGL